MLSRLKSKIKRVLGREESAAAPPAAKVAPPPAAAKPAAPAKPVEAPKSAEPPQAAEAAKPADAPKKISLAAAAAAAAKGAPVSVAKASDTETEEEKKARLGREALAAAQAKKQHLHADTGSTDKESYVLRAKANGRDPATYVVGEEGLNTLADGTQFWGPVNNSSSRSKAAGEVLTIDQFECISCGTCVEQTEKVFYLPADGKAAPIAQDGPMDLIEDAIEACPVTCIAWMPAEEAEERGLATGMEGEAAS